MSGQAIAVRADRASKQAEPRELAFLSKACQALTEAKSLDDVKKIRDQAVAVGYYVRAQKLGTRLQNDAAEVKIQAERRAGEMLATMKVNGERHSGRGNNHKLAGRNDPPKLKDMGVSAGQSKRWQKVAAIPAKKFDAVIAETKAAEKELTTTAMLKEASADKKEKKREAKQKAKSAVPDDLPAADARYRLIHGDLATAEVEAGSLDWIVTDPPYPKDFLPVYDKLAEFAERTLKPGGSLLAMVGQSYLPDIIASLAKRLTYHWTIAYLTPGGQSVQLWERKVNTFWKPVLWMVKGEYAGDWIGDVSRSDVNDNDKNHHHWGQSESGMADLIERFTYPGQSICDPFVGGGTTGVVAVQMNRMFIGIDIDADCISKTQSRLAELK